MISRKFTIWACGLLFVFGSCAEDMVKPIENEGDIDLKLLTIENLDKRHQ